MAATDSEPTASPSKLLDQGDIDHLIRQGYLCLDLEARLADLCRSLFVLSETFLAYQDDTKQALYPKSQGTELGYYSIGGEKQYVTLRHAISRATGAEGSESAAQLEAVAAALWKRSAELLMSILHQISDALEISNEAWAPMLDGCLELPKTAAEMTPTLLRLFKYLPSTGVAEEHLDLGMLTLCVGGGKGLQVKGPDKGSLWQDVEGPCILTGRTLHMLSGQEVTPGLHRVVGNPDGRSSIVFALRPSTRNPIPLESFGGEGVVPGEEMWQQVQHGVRNINATKDTRDPEKQKKSLLKRLLRKGEK